MDSRLNNLEAIVSRRPDVQSENIESDRTDPDQRLEQSKSEYDSAHFRLTQQIEEEEKAFARATTKFAMDAAKEETQKVVMKASKLEQMCSEMQDRMKRFPHAASGHL